MTVAASHDPPSAGGRSLLPAAALTYGANLAAAVLSLANVFVVARTLGPVGRGNVAFLTAIAWLTSNLATLGIQEATANLAGTHPDSRRSLATNAVVFSLIFGLGTVAVLGALVAFVPAVGGDAAPALRWLTFACLPVIILGIYLRFLLQADYGFTVTNAAWLITPLANVGVNGGLAVAGALSVATAVCTWLAGQMLQTVVLVVYVARRSEGFGAFDGPLARRSLAFGARSHAGRAMLLGNYRLDQWLLGVMSGPRELGLYSVAVAWAEALWFLPTTLAAVQRPDLVRGERRSAARVAALAFRLAAVLTVAAAVVMIVAAPILCVTVFGDDFRGSVPDLRILAVGALGVVALKQLGNALTAQRRPTLTSIAIGSAFAITIVLDVILIPRYGGTGAAVASTVSYLLGGVAVGVIFARALGVDPRTLVPRLGDVGDFARAARRIMGRRQLRAGES